MKKTIVFALLLFSTLTAHADSIRCYVGGKTVYYRNVFNVTFTGDLFVFEELPSERIVMINGECVVKIDT